MSAAIKSLLCLAAVAAALAAVPAAQAATPAPGTTTTTPKRTQTATTPRATTTTARTATTRTTTRRTTTTPAQVGSTGPRCWQDLIKDWYDGRIDKTYPVHCYRDALKNLPQDVETYSDAYDVISRALADATRGKKNVDPDALVPPPAGPGGGNGTGTTGGNGGGPGGNGGNGETTATPGKSPIDDVLNTGDKGASGIPIPLLVLGGLALLLVAAGAAGLIARRVQARRGHP